MSFGLIHIYCGDGKGKTTSAIGLGIRAVGAGKKVLLTQFLKPGNSSELNILKNIDNFFISDGPKKLKFTFLMNSKEFESEKQRSHKLILESFNTKNIDMLILDEVLDVLSIKMIDEDFLLGLIKAKPSNLELVLTGRKAPQKILDEADYVSEIKKIKHPYDEGKRARKGIEF